MKTQFTRLLKSKIPKFLVLFCTFFFSEALLKSNNISITNVALGENNSTLQNAKIIFDISWENSWRTDAPINNWDAAWVFVKYRTSSGWGHAKLPNVGYTIPEGTIISPGLVNSSAPYNASTNPTVGVFIYRTNNGGGTFAKQGVQLQWNYNDNGITYTDILEIRVFGIEMVYVPQGSFYIGSGGAESGRFFRADAITQPFQITSEGAFNTASTGAGNLWGNGGTGANNGVAAGTGVLAIPAAFPKGFAAFYCMKYSISQQAYVDFLNTLNYVQQNTRTETVPNASPGTGALSSTNANRNGIDIQTSGIASTTPALYACNLNGNTTYGEASDGQWLACNWLSWADVAAYLDWCGLRPMTELEYEKACRGTINPVVNEYAWGTAAIAGTTSTANGYNLNNSGQINETVTYSGDPAINPSSNGNCAYIGTTGANSNSPIVDGPLRVGAFSTASSTRISSGASFYGIMELSGNVWERPVDVRNGRTFTGLHGDGLIDASGIHNVTNWPATTANGVGFRGGNWGSFGQMNVSSRPSGSQISTARQTGNGGRGVRTAP